MKLFFILGFSLLLHASVSEAQNLVVRVRTVKNSATVPELVKDSRVSQKIFKKENGLYDVITLVSMNDYLAGVLSKEMPLSWPEEALKAQAVVARSFLLARMSDRSQKKFHVESDQMDQVFSLTDSAKAYKAVRETENVFLMSAKNKILKAFYHSDCGGQTVPASQVWSGADDSGTAKDPWCAVRESNRWSFAVSAEFFNQKTQALDRNELGTVYYKDRLMNYAGISLQKMREIFGFSVIRNSPLIVSADNQQIVFKGQGFGHGAGLCQWGSRYLAQKGRSYLDILKHYYPKALISDNKIKLAQFKSKLFNDLTFKM